MGVSCKHSFLLAGGPTPCCPPCLPSSTPSLQGRQRVDPPSMITAEAPAAQLTKGSADRDQPLSEDRGRKVALPIPTSSNCGSMAKENHALVKNVLSFWAPQDAFFIEH